jgi:hypothetical protein
MRPSPSDAGRQEEEGVGGLALPDDHLDSTSLHRLMRPPLPQQGVRFPVIRKRQSNGTK